MLENNHDTLIICAAFDDVLLHSIISNAVIFSGALLSEFSTPFIRLLDLVRMATTIGTGQMFCFGLNFNKYYSSSDTIQLAI